LNPPNFTLVTGYAKFNLNPEITLLEAINNNNYTFEIKMAIKKNG